MFVDIAKILIKAGDGGDGKISFRREKYVTNGGPDGGDGGNGGDVVFIADENLRTLMDFRYKRKHISKNGEQGGSNNSSGKSAENLYIRVPVGTIIRDVETGLPIGDLKNTGDKVTAALGGKGGFGNAQFATPTRQAPRFARPGIKGEERWVELELKLLADVGLLGYPNVGKSTFLSVVTSARPKIANYHFTTLVPNLGVVDLGNSRSFVIADIPGIIEGANEGVGLGHDFLRHVERTKILIHVLDVSGIEGRDPYEDFIKINQELEKYNQKLSKKPQIIACNKMDIPEAEEMYNELREKFINEGYEIFPISAATKQGIQPLMNKVYNILEQVIEDDENVEELMEIMYHKNTDEKPYSIKKEGDVYIVEGRLVDQLLESINLEDSDSAKYFQKVLRKRGIIDDLKSMGVEDGDTVKMYDLEFEYFD